MPFKSEAQRRYLWANEPEIARDWTDTYGSRIQKKNGGIMSIQGGVENYEPSEMVNAPMKAKSSPDHPTAHLAYITPEEQDILIDLNLYGSLKGKPNRGPAGIPSLQGDFGGPGGFGGYQGGADHGGVGSKGNTGDVSGSRDTGTGNYERSSRPGDVAAQKAFDASFGITGSKPKGFFNTIGTGIKDYITSGGLIGMGIRGLKDVFGKFGSGWDSSMGPREDMGYNPNKNNPFSGPDRGGDGPYIPPQYNWDDLYAQNIMEEDDIDIDTSTGNMEDWVQRFRVDDQYRQDKGALDPQIREMISKLYT